MLPIRSVLAAGSEHVTPEWLDWFSAARLAAFKGNTQLKAGHLPQARTTLLGVLAALDPSEEKQTTVVLGDLAAVEATMRRPGRSVQIRGPGTRSAGTDVVRDGHGPDSGGTALARTAPA